MISSKIDKYKIYSYHADHTRRLTLVSLAKFLQETAGEHAEELGIGYSKFKERNHAWVLYKQVINMDEWPLWGDEISIKTWPSVVDRLMCYREFEIYNSKEKLIGKVSTSWIVINLETRRPVRTSKYYDLPQTGHDMVNFPNKIRNKMHFDDKADSTRSYQVQLQDIDVNDHVNNTSYIDWALNYYTPDFVRNHHLQEAELQFQQETFFRDQIQLDTILQAETDHLHQIKRDGAILVQIRLNWIKK
jgi:acyl-ACP thioesterase